MISKMTVDERRFISWTNEIIRQHGLEKTSGVSELKSLIYDLIGYYNDELRELKRKQV